ncbi:MAG: hypothetical protein H0W58_03455 [Acidobacteria bacterium]|jgi:hypothetical protein|nr:hypothetical protein [Acidobacteriota bacterium]
MTKNCKNCNRTFDNENVLIDFVGIGYGEKIEREFFERHKTSNLCDDCLLDEIIAKSQSTKTS